MKRNILLLLAIFLAHVTLFAGNYYWVGGSGNWSDINHWRTTSGGGQLPAVIPSQTDDVFFDANSGFTSSSKTVTLDQTGYCHNITFDGCAVPPKFTGEHTFNIYGSSQWQTGMPDIDFPNIYYRNNNEDRTIKSNGVITGVDRGYDDNRGVYFEEQNSISLLDSLISDIPLHVNAGTFNTNNHTVRIGRNFYSEDCTLNLGSSSIYFGADWHTKASNVTVNAGTSTIYGFYHYSDDNESNENTMYVKSSDVYHNVVFQEEGILKNENTSGSARFNKVTFLKNGEINNNNTFNELVLTPGYSYELGAGKTQTVTNQLYPSGNPCFLTTIKSTSSSRAYLDVRAGDKHFDFAVVKNIYANRRIYFGKHSTNDGGNYNITFAPYESGEFRPLGDNWICHTFTSDPDSYTLRPDIPLTPTQSFEWRKLHDPNHTGIIATTKDLDIQTLGSGSYSLQTTFNQEGSERFCQVMDSMTVLRQEDQLTVDEIVQPNCARAKGQVRLSNLPLQDWVLQYGTNQITGSADAVTVSNLDEGTHSFVLTTGGCTLDPLTVEIAATENGIDSDGDGVEDLCDLDDDNDGILDKDEACMVFPTPQLPDSRAKTWTSGDYTYFVQDQTTDATGYQKSGFEKYLIEQQIFYQHHNEEDMFSVTTGATQADNVVYFPGGTITYEGAGLLSNPVDFGESTESAVNSGSSGDVAYINVKQPANANDKYGMYINLNEPVKAFSFDAVDILDPSSGGDDKNVRVNILVDDQLQFYFTGRTTHGSIGTYELFDASDNSQGTIKAGNLQENTFGIVSNQAFTKVTFEIVMLDAVTSNYWDWIGVDNFVYSFECNMDFDNDGIPNHLDLDSDNDGCLDAFEGTGNLNPNHFQLAQAPLTVGVGSTAENKNLGNEVYTLADNLPERLGVPKVAGAGQGLGEAQDPNKNSACGDSDDDGIADWEDLDDDNDGILDTEEDCRNTNSAFMWEDFPTPSSGGRHIRHTPTSITIPNSDGLQLTCTKIDVGELMNTDTMPDNASYQAFRENRISSVYPWGWDYNNGQFLVLAQNFYYYDHSNDTSHFWGNHLEMIEDIYSEYLFEFSNPVSNLSFDLLNLYPRVYIVRAKLIIIDENNTEYVLQPEDYTLEEDITYTAPNTFSGGGAPNSANDNFRKVTINPLPVKVKSFKIIFKSGPFVQLEGEAAIGLSRLSFTNVHCGMDTDNDGIPNRLDLDSDNDGCLDAIEGGADFTADNLQAAHDSLSVGVGSTAENKNLGNQVYTPADNQPERLGVPKIAEAGQDKGFSQDVNLNACLDSDNDGIADVDDLDDDNDGILDVNETCTMEFPTPQEANSRAKTWTSGGYTYFVQDQTTDATGYKDSGFEKYLIEHQIAYQHHNEEDMFSVTPGATQAENVVHFPGGTITYEGAGLLSDPVDFGESTESAVNSGSSGDVAYINVKQPANANDKYGMYINLNQPVKAFSFDAVDILDPYVGGEDKNVKVNILVDDQVQFYFTGRTTNGSVGTFELFDASTNVSQGTIKAGDLRENTFGIVSNQPFSKVTFEIIMLDAVTSNYWDWIGVDNFVYSFPCSVDFDNDGIPNHLDLDSDNDGCLDALEGGADFTTDDLFVAYDSLTVGVGSTAENKNLGNVVYTLADNQPDRLGVPKIAQAGQGIGGTQDAVRNDCGEDSDGDGIADWEDLDDDNDGILDVNEICTMDFPTPQPADSRAKIFTNGDYTYFVQDQTTDATGYQKSGFEKYLIDHQIAYQHHNETDGFSVSSGATQAENVVHFTGGTIAYEGAGLLSNPVNFGESTESPVNSGSSGDAAYINVKQSVNAGDKYGMYIYLNQPVKAFSFDAVDILDPGAGGENKNVKVNILVDDQLQFYFTGKTTKGSIGTFELFDASNVSQGTIKAGDLQENTFGIVAEQSFTKVTFEIVMLDAVSSNYWDWIGIDNFVYSFPCSVDFDNDGIPNHLDLDSDNDGCPDAIEGGADFTADNLQAAEGSLSVGVGSTAQNSNLGIDVYTLADNQPDRLGVPKIAGAGQSIGNSQDDSQNDCGETPILLKDDLTQTPKNVSVKGSVLTNDVGVGIKITHIEGEEVPENGLKTVQVSGGVLSISSDGSYTFVPQENFVGQIPVLSYTAEDASGNNSVATLDIKVLDDIKTESGLNDEPVANDDILRTHQNQEIVFNIMNNDFDADRNRELSVTEVVINGETVVVPPNGQITSQAIISNGVTIGHITIKSNGEVTFVPSSDFTGRVPEIEYTINDAHGTGNDENNDGKAKAKIRIEVMPEQTNLYANDDYGVARNAQDEITLNILNNDIKENASVGVNDLTIKSLSLYNINGVLEEVELSDIQENRILYDDLGNKIGVLKSLDADGNLKFVGENLFKGTLAIPYVLKNANQKTNKATIYLTQLISDDNPQPLPIVLYRFNASPNKDNTITLDWVSLTEINNDYYSLYKSDNAENWVLLEEVEGAGNSLERQTYRTIDTYAYVPVTYYKLEQTDFDGKTTTLGIRSVNLLNQYLGRNTTEAWSLYPNPTKGRVTVQGAYSNIDNIRVLNNLGVDVRALIQIKVLSANSLDFDLRALTSGIYFIYIDNTVLKIVRE